MIKLRRQDLLTWIMLAAMVLYLIFDSRSALIAGKAGVELCLRAVIPSLFPFFVLTRLLAASPVTARLSGFLGPVMERVFHLPGAASAAVVLGALGGYPTGAKTTAELLSAGSLSKEEAERLLPFCNNAGPGFIFGILGPIFGLPGTAILLLIHLTSAIITGILLRRPSTGVKRAPATPPQQLTLPEAIAGALSAMGAVCAYVVLFSIVSAAVTSLSKGILPNQLILILTGLMELTSGCTALARLPGDHTAFLLSGLFLSFGGLCVWCQVKSVTAPAGLTGKYYLPSKALQALFSTVLILLLQFFLPDLFFRETAAVPSNHHGLLAATLWVSLAFSLLFLIFAALVRKKAGKTEAELV